MGVCEDKSLIVCLIEEVRQGSQSAFSQMLDRYKPLLEAAVVKFLKDENCRPHEDDLRQEATLAFYNAILNYDLTSYEVEFGLYAKICVTNALISHARSLSRRSAEQFSGIISELGTSLEEEPSARLIDIENLQQTDAFIRRSLSPLEYRVWCLYVSGKTAGEIGELIGKNEKSVNNAVYRIRKKLRELLS